MDLFILLNAHLHFTMRNLNFFENFCNILRFAA